MAAFLEFFPNDGDLERYIRHVADMVGLRDWKIVLDNDSPGDDNAGACRVTYGRRIAHIRLAEHDTIEELRCTIVHELLHCHLEPIDWNNNNLQTIIGDPMYTLWRGSFVDAMEVATDAMATAWASYLPLPEKQEAA